MSAPQFVRPMTAEQLADATGDDAATGRAPRQAPHPRFWSRANAPELAAIVAILAICAAWAIATWRL